MDRCALCPAAHRVVPPSGPMERGGLLFIGESPNITDDKQGMPFTGKTGDEVNRHYLPLANLRRDEVTFCNAISCLPTTPGGKLTPSKHQHLALLDSCAATHLYPLIERMEPRVLIPLGSFACRAVNPEIDVELHHGYPVGTDWGIPAFPSFHPALGMHSPKQMLYIRSDWGRLRQYLNGTLRLPTDPYPNPDYTEVTDAREIDDLDPTRALAGDTESSREGPFCLTFSQEPGTGRLIRAERGDLLRAFQAKLDVWAAPILFHHWLYDWPILEAMGLSVPHHRLVDTMVRAYHLGNLPQGLKALAWRELGMEMQDFEDLVGPHSRARVLDYYTRAAMLDWPKPEPQKVFDDRGQEKDYKPQSMNTKFKRFFTDYQKNPDTKDPIESWENWTDAHAMIEAELGPWPGMDIRHAPWDQVLFYSCRDADSLIRLWPILQGMTRVVRKYSQDHWRAKGAA